VRAILIIGKPEIFTAGIPRDFLKNAKAVEGMPVSERPVFKFMLALERRLKPLVAAVSGAAIGIGTTMLDALRPVYAADNRQFSMRSLQLGMCPEIRIEPAVHAVGRLPARGRKATARRSLPRAGSIPDGARVEGCCRWTNCVRSRRARRPSWSICLRPRSAHQGLDEARSQPAVTGRHGRGEPAVRRDAAGA